MTYVNPARAAGVIGIATTLLILGGVVSSAHAGNAAKQRASAGQAAAGSWSRSTEVQRTPTGYTRQDQWSNAKGRTASRSVVVSNDAASGTRNRNAVRTGPAGRSTTVDAVTRRTDSGYTREVTRTLPDGTAKEHSVDVSCDKAAQSCVKTVTRGDGG